MKGNGNSVPWIETEMGRHINHRLNQPTTLRSIDHLLDRLDTVEQAVERIAGLLAQGPGLVSMATDTADELLRDTQKRGIDLTERMQNVLYLLEKLTAKDTVAKLDQVLQLADQLPGLVAMGMDVADENVNRLNTSGINLDALSELAVISGTALSNAKQENISELGLFGLLKAMNDKDRQKGLGFLMNLLKQLGKQL